MAKLQLSSAPLGFKKKRKGIHAKSKSSKLKSSRNYKKAYRGQGR